MTGPAHITETECWRVSGLRDTEAFLRAIPLLLPEATRVFLEGSPAEEFSRAAGGELADTAA
jgi:hypothetical protein